MIQIDAGPITQFLNSPDVSEIMVNGPDKIFVEQAGRIFSCPKRFQSQEELQRVVRQLLTLAGKQLSPQTPLIDSQLEDGSRLTVACPPIAPRLSFTIRRATMRVCTLAELIRAGSVTEPVSAYLTAAIRNKKNIFISGGTSCGKTTFLNALAGEIPLHERIVTIEDTYEIRLRHPNWLQLQTLLMAPEPQRVDMRDLVAHALHLRPDRILLGECRGSEAFDILQAMNSGHSGSLATIHANSPGDALSRLETLVLLAGFDLPLAAVRQQIAHAVNIIVQMRRTPEGQRHVTSVAEVLGYRDGQILLQTLLSQTGDAVGTRSPQPMQALPMIGNIQPRQTHELA
jgi:pilus assembly protein CpaF